MTGFRPRVSVITVHDNSRDLQARALEYLLEHGRPVDSSSSLLNLQSELLSLIGEPTLKDDALRLSDAIDDAPAEPRLAAAASLVVEARHAGRPCVLRVIRQNDMEYAATHLNNIGIQTRVVNSATEASKRGDTYSLLREGIVLIGGGTLDSSLASVPPSSTLIYWNAPRQLKGFVDSVALGSRSADVHLQYLASEGADVMVAEAIARMANEGRRPFTAADWDELST